MSGFDHSALATQVAGQIEYLAGDSWRFSFGALADLPALMETVPPPPELLLEAERKGNVQFVALTFAAALFAGKRPTKGQSFRAVDGRDYRIVKTEGETHDISWRFTCTTTKPAA